MLSEPGHGFNQRPREWPWLEPEKAPGLCGRKGHPFFDRAQPARVVCGSLPPGNCGEKNPRVGREGKHIDKSGEKLDS